jgi:hypothetical protein
VSFYHVQFTTALTLNNCFPLHTRVAIIPVNNCAIRGSSHATFFENHATPIFWAFIKNC